MTDLLTLLQKYSSQPSYNLIQFPPKIIYQGSSSWMNSIFGFNDNMSPNNIFENRPSNLEKSAIIKSLIQVYDDQTGLLRLNSDYYKAGWFISPTVQEIRTAISQINPKRGTPNIYVVVGKDIGEAHLQGNAYSIFQGASQFNALEMVNVDKTPYDGIGIYINDNTQGPRTAIACAPGTFVRNYWLTSQYSGQFNALEHMELSHLNGYLVWGTNPYDVQSKIRPELLMIPCMVYTQVAGVTKDKNGQVSAHATNKLVHQIYSSGVPIDTYRNGGNKSTQLEIARSLIKAGYIGAIGMGLLLHTIDKMSNITTLPRPSINLTLIGGGVFNVPTNVILESIRDAITEFNQYEFDIQIHGYQESTAKEIATFFNIKIIPFDSYLQQPPSQLTPQLTPQLPTQLTPQPSIQQPQRSPIQLPSPQLIQRSPIQLPPQPSTQLIQRSPIQLPPQPSMQQPSIYQQNRLFTDNAGNQPTVLVPQILIPKADNQPFITNYVPRSPSQLPLLPTNNGPNNYLLVTNTNKGLKGYRLRDYQEDMLEKTLALGGNYQQSYSAPLVNATLFSYSGRDSSQRKIGFITEDGNYRYFVNIRTDPKLGRILPNPDGSYDLYDKSNNLITEW